MLNASIGLYFCGFLEVTSYYSIISSDGRTLVDSVPMQHAKLNGAEELKVKGGTALWVYADGNGKDADIYQLDTSSVSSDVFKKANVELAYDEKTYTGKALKPALPVKYDGKTLKNGKDYTVSYKNNKKPGLATVTVKGKVEYYGTATATFKIAPKAVTNFKAVCTTKQVPRFLQFIAICEKRLCYAVYSVLRKTLIS